MSKIYADIIIKPRWGVHLPSAAQHAVDVANRLGQRVEFSFNPPDPKFDDTLTVYPGDDVNRIVEWALSGKEARLNQYERDTRNLRWYR
jgi:hypothetical protein